MKQLKSYINIRKGPSIINATNDNIRKIIKTELDILGYDADLNHIDTSEVTRMRGAFSCDRHFLGRSYKNLNPDISKWDVSKVTDMVGMFWNCKNFNCDISEWDVSNVEQMRNMFSGCRSFNQDLSRWDINKVRLFDGMFDQCPIKEEYKPKLNYSKYNR